MPGLTDDEPELNQDPGLERVDDCEDVGQEEYDPGSVLHRHRTDGSACAFDPLCPTHRQGEPRVDAMRCSP